MKKLWILLVALMVLAAMPSFSKDVTFSGDFRSFANTDFEGGGGAAISRNRIWWDVTVDDYNKVRVQVEDRGFAAGSGAFVRTLKLDTDFGAALGLPFGLTGTFGRFDPRFTGWWYKDSAGWAWYYDWPNQIVGAGFKDKGAMQLNLGFGPAGLHWWNDAIFENFMVGVDGALAGFNWWLAYGSSFAAAGEGNLSVEAKYDVAYRALNGFMGAYFRYSLGGAGFGGPYAAGDWVYGVNLGADYGMFGVGLGISGTNRSDVVTALDKVIAQLTVSPVAAATIGAAMFFDGGEFLGVDLSASYKVGAAMFALGYVVGDPVPVLASGDTYTANGLYAGVKIAY